MASPPRDHNKPPEPVIDSIDPTKLVDVPLVVGVLKHNYKALEERRDELKLGIARWIAAHTEPKVAGSRPQIVDDADCGDTLDYLTQLREFGTKEVEPARKAVKEPLDKAAKAVQAYFVDGLAEVIKSARQPLEDAYSLFLVEKQQEVVRARQQAALEQQKMADRLARQASRATSLQQQDALLEQAIDAEQEVERLKAAAGASVADVTRVRGDMGSVGGLKTTWHYEVEELMDLVQAVAQGREPVVMLTDNDSYIGPLVRPANGRRKIPGLRIFSEQKGR